MSKLKKNDAIVFARALRMQPRGNLHLIFKKIASLTLAMTLLLSVLNFELWLCTLSSEL